MKGGRREGARRAGGKQWEILELVCVEADAKDEMEGFGARAWIRRSIFHRNSMLACFPQLGPFPFKFQIFCRVAALLLHARVCQLSGEQIRPLHQPHNALRSECQVLIYFQRTARRAGSHHLPFCSTRRGRPEMVRFPNRRNYDDRSLFARKKSHRAFGLGSDRAILLL